MGEDNSMEMGRVDIDVARADELGRILSEMDERLLTDVERAVALVRAWERLKEDGEAGSGSEASRARAEGIAQSQ